MLSLLLCSCNAREFICQKRTFRDASKKTFTQESTFSHSHEMNYLLNKSIKTDVSV